MKYRTYTLDQAAALLNMGRNTLAQRMREAGFLGSDNLPTGPYRGKTQWLLVATGTYHHPICGWTHYGRTELTDAGLDLVARKLGVDIEHLPQDNHLQAGPLAQEARSITHG